LSRVLLISYSPANLLVLSEFRFLGFRIFFQTQNPLPCTFLGDSHEVFFLSLHARFNLHGLLFVPLSRAPGSFCMRPLPLRPFSNVPMQTFRIPISFFFVAMSILPVDGDFLVLYRSPSLFIVSVCLSGFPNNPTTILVEGDLLPRP